MPRRIRDINLTTRTARLRLPVRHDPYYRQIQIGLFVGYRRLAGRAGTWLKRHLVDGRYVNTNLRTVDGAPVVADDFVAADGLAVMNFAQAQERVRGPHHHRSSGAYTVGDALNDHLIFLEHDGRSRHSISDARSRIKFIRSQIGTLKLTSLTPERLRRWLNDLANTPPRLRTRKGEQQKYRDVSGEDAQRSRRATTNRLWTVARSALNHALATGKVDSDKGWRGVKPFRSVDTARVRYLSIAEAQRLINGCDSDFRPVVQGALETGCRWGELCALQVSDFHPDSGTINIRKSKGGKPRHVVLTPEGERFFVQLTLGCSPTDPMFGRKWGQSHQIRRMNEACQRVRISPPASFHVLRHTWASHAVMGGVPLMVVAKNLGHVDTRMVENHYGHLAPSYIADAIRAGAPRFGVNRDEKLTSFERRR
jgi:integrase